MYLQHHGILGQHWGKRNGPPYPLGGGDYSKPEREKIYKHRHAHPNSIYNKKHFDEVLKTDKDTLSTLSYNKDRLKGVDMYYATHKSLDKHQYNALFNKPVKDIDGHTMLKYKINTKVKSDMKVASEDSSAEIFRNLYKKDRDFFNFVTDENRMQSYFVQDKFKFKGYREGRKILEKLRNDENYTPTSEELQKAYRLFNYVIPYDGGGNDSRGAHDVTVQRAKFFKAAKEAGYGAILDTNDAIYGAFKATHPVIVFDMGQVIPSSIKQTSTKSKAFSSAVTIGRKVIGI